MLYERNNVRQENSGEVMVNESCIWLQRATPVRSTHCTQGSNKKPAAARCLKAYTVNGV